jgi:type 1 glutamine amidotransferase
VTSKAFAHVIAGGYPPGAFAGHDIDYARLRLLEFLEARRATATVAGDFTDIEKWLPERRFLITYVAGPFADERQAAFINEWLEGGGRWLGLHGSAGGKAARVGDGFRRTMVKSRHHEVLGGFFFNHPPVRRFAVDVNCEHPLAQGLPERFEVIDELYMIEVQDAEHSDVLLTTELAGDPSPPGFGFVYERDSSLGADGKTRVLAYTRDVGQGGVAYVALGHCHTPESSVQPFVDESVDPDGKTPAVMRGSWDAPAFQRLLANAIDWGLDS